MKPLIAIVGRPNVGKSMLFNKLVGQRLSIVEDTPGVTRDRLYAEAEWRNRKFDLVDTGGIEPDTDSEILQFMRQQAEIAIQSATVIVFVCDIQTGLTASDQEVASMLLKSGKPVVLAVNKMDQTGILDTFIPKDWADANGTTADAYTGFLPLQTLNKVFMYNCTGDKTYDNCWDFVAEGEHGLYMDIDSEIVGKNFLYMLTRDDYAAWMKESFEALSDDEKAYFQPTITEMEADAADLGLGADGAYALAWIKLWVESYNAQTDDGPICNTLVDASAKDQFGLLVYSKLRSVEESSSVSVNNIKVAAYEDGYQGIGGYGYCHYLFVTDNSPLPWTACAFIAYMTCTADGFSAWGKDMGGYSSNPTVAEETEANFHHSIGGMAEDGTTVEFAAKNDRGYEWWTTNGKLVLEDPEYCADVAFTVGSWIEMLTKYSAG